MTWTRDILRLLAAVNERRREDVELGRYLVGEAGVYVTRVVDRKVSRGKTFLVVDGGMHHQLAASGNFGQAIRRNYPIAMASRVDGSRTEKVSVVGCCAPRWTSSATTSSCRSPKWAISSRSSWLVPTA